MKIHYAGKFNLDESSLPKADPVPSAVAFKEPEDSKKLGQIANAGALVILVILMGIAGFRIGQYSSGGGSGRFLFLNFFLALLASLPMAMVHEFIHALCFREDVYVYTNLKQGMLFVVGPEDMSKGRFIFMSLLPSIVLGLIPYIAGFTMHNVFLATLGAMSLGMGAGDYINVWNALWQMPRGALTYLYGFHSFWYRPDDGSRAEAAEE